MTPPNQSKRGPVGDFMDAHLTLGEVECTLYGNRITVAASAAGGKPRVAVHGRTKNGHHIGGLMSADDAQLLVNLLNSAITYAEGVAREQRVAEIPDLERRLAEACQNG